MQEILVYVLTNLLRLEFFQKLVALKIALEFHLMKKWICVSFKLFRHTKIIFIFFGMFNERNPKWRDTEHWTNHQIISSFFLFIYPYMSPDKVLWFVRCNVRFESDKNDSETWNDDNLKDLEYFIKKYSLYVICDEKYQLCKLELWKSLLQPNE